MAIGRGIARGLKKAVKGKKSLSAKEKKVRELKRAKTKTPATYESEVKRVRQMALTDEMRKDKLAKLAAKYGKPKPKTAMKGGPRPAPKKKPMAKTPPPVALGLAKGGPDKVTELYKVQAKIREKAKKAGMSVKRFRQLHPNDPSVKRVYALRPAIKQEDATRKFKQDKKKK